MNRSMKTAVQVFGIIVIILLCTAIMNFGLAKVLGQGYILLVKTYLSSSG